MPNEIIKVKEMSCYFQVDGKERLGGLLKYYHREEAA
jgi:hypothetical protein